jgi:hypothetical protein
LEARRIRKLIDYFLLRDGIFKRTDLKEFVNKDMRRNSFPIIWRANAEEFGDGQMTWECRLYSMHCSKTSTTSTRMSGVGFDAWGNLVNKSENELFEDEQKLLDEIAEFTSHVDAHFNGLRNLYCTTPYGQAVQNKLSSN